MSETKVYNPSEIFKEDPANADNVKLTLPPEIYEKLGWKQGDKLKIKIDSDSITIIKV